MQNCPGKLMLHFVRKKQFARIKDLLHCRNEEISIHLFIPAFFFYSLQE